MSKMILIDEAKLSSVLEVMQNQGDVSVDEWIAAEKALREALAEQPAQQKPACFNGLVDTDGENKAVRCLLMLYGERGLTVGAMKTHLSMSGFKMWPDWVEREPDGAHLTKSGAQLWIRHLFSLEQPAQQALDKIAENARELGLDYEPAQQQEPVAWMWKDGTITSDPDRADGTWMPLYTTPPAQRKPLHMGEEVAAFKEWFDAWWVGDGDICKAVTSEVEQTTSYKTQYTLAFGAWMAAKEAAHGIKENT